MSLIDDIFTTSQEYRAYQSFEVGYGIDVAKSYLNVPYSFSAIGDVEHEITEALDFGFSKYLDPTVKLFASSYKNMYSMLARPHKMIKYSFESISRDSIIRSNAIGYNTGVLIGGTAFSRLVSDINPRKEELRKKSNRYIINALVHQMTKHDWNYVQHKLKEIGVELQLSVIFHAPVKAITPEEFARAELLKTRSLPLNKFLPAFIPHWYDADEVYKVLSAKPGNYDLCAYGVSDNHFGYSPQWDKLVDEITEFLDANQDKEFNISYSYIGVEHKE